MYLEEYPNEQWDMLEKTQKNSRRRRCQKILSGRQQEEKEKEAQQVKDNRAVHHGSGQWRWSNGNRNEDEESERKARSWQKAIVYTDDESEDSL